MCVCNKLNVYFFLYIFISLSLFAQPINFVYNKRALMLSKKRKKTPLSRYIYCTNGKSRVTIRHFCRIPGQLILTTPHETTSRLLHTSHVFALFHLPREIEKSNSPASSVSSPSSHTTVPLQLPNHSPLLKYPTPTLPRSNRHRRGTFSSLPLAPKLSSLVVTDDELAVRAGVFTARVG